MRPGRFLTDRRGAVSLFAALGVMSLITFSALAVDLGAVFLVTRRLQGTADLAAMAAARDLDHADAAANATAQANNGGTAVQVTVTKGSYLSDDAVAPQARFQAGGLDPNAARVRLSAQAPLF